MLLTSDVPDSLSWSGSGRILLFLSDIRIRPDLDKKKEPDPFPAESRLKTRSGSGSGRILTEIRPIRI